MDHFLHLVCPACEALNRVPTPRLDASPNCGKCHRPLFSAKPLEAGEATFARHVMHNDIPLLVDFWAPWCGPCRTMAPQFQAAAAQLEPRMRLVKVDTQVETALAARYAIRSIPTLALFKGGREVARQAGAMSAAGIVQWASAHAD